MEKAVLVAAAVVAAGIGATIPPRTVAPRMPTAPPPSPAPAPAPVVAAPPPPVRLPAPPTVSLTVADGPLVGSLFDADGRPVGGALLFAASGESIHEAPGVVTAGDGTFRFAARGAAGRRLRFDLGPLLPSKPAPKPSTPIASAPDAEKDPEDADDPPSPVLDVRLPDGNVPVSVSVEVTTPTENGTTTWRTTSPRFGGHTSPLKPGATVTVSAGDDGEWSSDPVVVTEEMLAAGVIRVPLRRREGSSLDVELLETPEFDWLHGRFEVRRLDGTVVETGRRLVPVGSVIHFPGEPVPLEPGRYVVAATFDGVAFSEAPVEVVAGRIARISVRAPPPDPSSLAEARVLDAAGAPCDADGFWWRIEVGPGAQFVMPARSRRVAAGRYRVFTADSLPAAPRFLRCRPAGAASVDVPWNPSERTYEFRATPPAIAVVEIGGEPRPAGRALHLVAQRADEREIGPPGGSDTPTAEVPAAGDGSRGATLGPLAKGRTKILLVLRQPGGELVLDEAEIDVGTGEHKLSLSAPALHPLTLAFGSRFAKGRAHLKTQLLDFSRNREMNVALDADGHAELVLPAGSYRLRGGGMDWVVNVPERSVVKSE